MLVKVQLSLYIDQNLFTIAHWKIYIYTPFTCFPIITSNTVKIQYVGRCHTTDESLGMYIANTALPRANKTSHSGFETQRRYHQKFKIGASVAPQKITPFFFYKEINITWFRCQCSCEIWYALWPPVAFSAPICWKHTIGSVNATQVISLVTG